MRVTIEPFITHCGSVSKRLKLETVPTLFPFHLWNQVPIRLWISTGVVVLSMLRQPSKKGSCNFNNKRLAKCKRECPWVWEKKQVLSQRWEKCLQDFPVRKLANGDAWAGNEDSHESM